MAGEYDEKFDQITELLGSVVDRGEQTAIRVDEMAGLLRTTVGRVDELRLEVRDMRSELRSNTDRLGSLESKFDLLSAQFTDVASMAIKDHPRIDDLEARVSVLESEAN